MRIPIALLLLLAVTAAAEGPPPSTCFGTTSDGRLERGWKLPASGGNFSAYSTAGRLLGRTYVHSTVHAIVLDAYQALADALPDRVFVYGETGKRKGGEFRPHRTHQNGLSVDFMVPVTDADGRSVTLPTHAMNKWGYGVEFDAAGRTDGLSIDFDAIAEHLYALHRAALARGADIRRVIFDPGLQPFLHPSQRWPYLREHVQFSTRPAWVRHDDHYHVDFDIRCERLL